LMARSSWPEDLSCHSYQHDDKSKSMVITLVVPAKHNKSTVISLSLNISCRSLQTRQVYCDHSCLIFLVIPAKHNKYTVITLVVPAKHDKSTVITLVRYFWSFLPNTTSQM
jgi:hypothetical protein